MAETTSLTVTLERPIGAALSPAQERAREYARRARAESTLRAYRTDWADFTRWCADQQLIALPALPETVAAYVASQAEAHRVATIARRCAAISVVHKTAGLDSPVSNELVRTVLKGIRRTLGVAPAEKAPLLPSTLRDMAAALPASLIGARDRALLLLGFAGAFRRSEIVALDVEDLSFTTDGLTVLLRRSKTDQEGQGRKIGIPHLPHSDACPVRAVREWLTAAGITEGPVFRAVPRPPAGCPVTLGPRLSSRCVALVIKRRLPAGTDSSQYAGHSLRSGFVTSAFRGGAGMKAVMRTTGHRSVAVLLRYDRETSLFKRAALVNTGL
ncbi:MAG: site-specific integrase [Bryobacteraceae bacterium]|nr:site-specific integrase [Bryobacteraceae bacterium]